MTITETIIPVPYIPVKSLQLIGISVPVFQMSFRELTT